MFYLFLNKLGLPWRVATGASFLHRCLFVLSLACGLTQALAGPAFMTNGLVAYYPFNGNANDESGFGNNAQLLAGASLAEGRFAGTGAVRIDGAEGGNNGVRITAPLVNAGQAQYSLNLWFKPENPGKLGQVLLNTTPHAGIGVSYHANNALDKTNKIGFLVGDGNAWKLPPVFSADRFPESQWQMLTLVKSGDQYSLYLDGSVQATATAATALWDRSLSFWLGSSGPFASVFAGSLDDFRVYNRALSPGEVGQLFAVESTDTPRKALATAQVVNGFVVGVELTDPGYGYTTAPAVRITGGGGSGAAAVATVESGVVTGITITNPGSGYTSTPKVSIASPLFSPELQVAVSRVTVTSKVVLGLKYLLESSSDLQTWAAVGEPFIAEAEELNQEYAVGETGRFFRITQVP